WLFRSYLQASAPDTEVPDSGLLPSPRRPKPYLFTPTQLTALCEAAQASRPRRSLRPHTHLFQGDLGDHALEALAVHGTGRGEAEVVVNDVDSRIGPASLAGALVERVLQTQALVM